MRFRTGAILGFAVGYYLGAKAGHERYRQLRRIVERVGPVRKVQAAVELGRERFRVEPEPLEAVLPPSPN
jgi:hypothetical protein